MPERDAMLPRSIGREPLPIADVPGPPAQWAAMPGSDGEFAEILRKLWRRKSLVLGSLLCALALATAIGVMLPPRFKATAQVRIGVPEAKVANIPAVISDMAVDVAAVQSETYMLQSRDLISRVVDRLALDKVPEFNPALREVTIWEQIDPRNLFRQLVRTLSPGEPSKPSPADQPGEPAEDPERETVIDNLLKRIEITPLDRSHVIGLGVESEDPVLAAQIANTLSRTYIEDQLIQKIEATERADKWLAEHIRRLREQLAKDERAVENFRREHGLYQARRDTVTSQQLAELNTQLILAQASKAEADSRLKMATAQAKTASSGDTVPEVLNSSLIQALKQQQSTVERRVAELSTRYGTRHPDMRNAQAELADIKRKIRGEVGKIISGLRNASEAADARYQALSRNLDRIKQTTGQDNEQTVALRALERESEASRMLFEEFLRRSKETDVQRDLQQPDARVVTRAAVPSSSSFPPMNMLFAVAVVGGTLIGILLVMLVEQLDGTFHTDEEVEAATGLPTLAVVPKVSRWRLNRDLVLKKPTSPYSEAMRKLDTILRLTDRENDSRVVMVASAVPNEGKSDVCLSLARMAAATGANVIVIDCDWRRPQLHSILRRPNRQGLGDLLAGRSLPDDVVYRDSSGAHLIFAGHLKPLHTHLLFSDRMRYLLESLTRHYDLVLIDTPPVLVGSEILHLSRLVDKAIYVVRWGRTPRDLVLKGLRQLAAVGAPVVGTVLSQVDAKRYRRYARSGPDYGYRAYPARRVA